MNTINLLYFCILLLLEYNYIESYQNNARRHHYHFALSSSTNSANKSKKKSIILPDLSQKSFPTIPVNESSSYGCNYDLVVLGSGPAGDNLEVDPDVVINFTMLIL
jgi:hypothetical protein